MCAVRASGVPFWSIPQSPPLDLSRGLVQLMPARMVGQQTVK